MPIHHYQPLDVACEVCRDGFDVLQKLADAPLVSCPACGAPVHRVISAATVVSGQAHRLSESHAAKNGFTQYRRAGKGVYEKTAGKGPGIIRGD
jgi:putative FmdB family regulatory protein